MGKTKALFICIVVLVSGCVNQPVPATEVMNTPTIAPTATDFVSATPSALPLVSSPVPTSTSLPSTPFPSQTHVPEFTLIPDVEEISPILYGFPVSDSFVLLGGVYKGEWLQPVHVSPYLQGATSIDVYQANTVLPVTLREWNFSPVCQNYFVDSAVPIEGSSIAVTRDWKVASGIAREIPTDDPVYSQAVADWFEQQGISVPEVHITRILQTDLEGDGVHEVLLSASYYASTVMPVTQAGDYSVVLLRKVNGNDVITLPIVAEYYLQDATAATYPNTYLLENVLDLNQDGQREIVVGIQRWEGLGAVIFEPSEGTFQRVLEVIC